jgi:hypothetical protein
VPLLVRAFDTEFFLAYEDQLLRQGFDRIGYGSFRRGYSRRHTVIKVPYNVQGFNDNISEAYCYKQHRDNPNDKGWVFAPCRLMPNGCLMMPFMKRVDYIDLPPWGHVIDGCQLGHYKGRMVVYDSAYNLTPEIISNALKWAQVSS